MAVRGLVLINTGDGKGKTTAALGMALRAAGHGMKVCIIQFIKGNSRTGEAVALTAAFPDCIELHITGTGFTWTQQQEAVEAAALAGWRLAEEKIMSGAFDMVILEEITYPIGYGIIPEAALLDLLEKRPPRLHVVITGRNASPGLIAHADLVTEMREIKHPYRSGIMGQKGIEF